MSWVKQLPYVKKRPEKLSEAFLGVSKINKTPPDIKQRQNTDKGCEG